MTSTDQEAADGRDSTAPTAAKRRVQEAALRLFATRGFDRTSVRQIMTECGLTQGALYNHFESKDQILYEIVRDAQESFADTLTPALDPALSPIDRLRAFVRAYIRFNVTHRDLARVVERTLRTSDTDQWRDVAEIRLRIRAVLREVLEQGVADGSFSIPDTSLATAAIVDMGGAVADWYRDDGRLGPDEVVESYVAMIEALVSAS